MTEEGEGEGKDPGFRVEDKRRFTEAGEPRAGGADDAEDAVAAEDGPTVLEMRAPAGAPQDAPVPDDDDARGQDLGEITFSGFVNGFAIQALMALGLMADAGSGVIRKDLGEAKTMIDILGMLRERTAGNLTEEEDRMMEEILYDLRMQYVREVHGESGPEGDLG
jgi:hypothetical protein